MCQVKDSMKEAGWHHVEQAIRYDRWSQAKLQASAQQPLTDQQMQVCCSGLLMCFSGCAQRQDAVCQRVRPCANTHAHTLSQEGSAASDMPKDQPPVAPRHICLV